MTGLSPAAAAARGVPTIIRAPVLLILCSKAADCTLETSRGTVINVNEILQVNTEYDSAATDWQNQGLPLTGLSQGGWLVSGRFIVRDSMKSASGGIRENSSEPQQCFSCPRQLGFPACSETTHSSERLMWAAAGRARDDSRDQCIVM